MYRFCVTREEPRLVSENHCLDAVAEVQLLEDVRNAWIGIAVRSARSVVLAILLLTLVI